MVSLSLAQVQPQPTTTPRKTQPAAERQARPHDAAQRPGHATGSSAADAAACEDDEALAGWLSSMLAEEPGPDAAGMGSRAAASPAQRRTPELTADQIMRVLEVAREIDPALGRRLRDSLERDPQAFRRAMQTSGRRLIDLADLKAREPALYQTKLAELRVDALVSRTAERLRQAMRNGSQGEIERLRTELKDYVQIQVAYTIKARTEYFLRLEKHLAAMKLELDKSMEDFKQTVENRMQQLIREQPAVAEVALDAAPSKVTQ
jgi:hypothetical protein